MSEGTRIEIVAGIMTPRSLTWQLVQDGEVLAVAGAEFASTDAAIQHARQARLGMRNADLIVSVVDIPKVKDSGRWRPIDPAGNVAAEPAPEAPDDQDEGETGPPEQRFEVVGDQILGQLVDPDA